MQISLGFSHYIQYIQVINQNSDTQSVGGFNHLIDFEKIENFKYIILSQKQICEVLSQGSKYLPYSPSAGATQSWMLCVVIVKNPSLRAES